MTDVQRPTRNWPFLLVIAVAIGVLGYRALSSRTAPTPPAFDHDRTLDMALADAAASGRPVLAFATADWCGPCQTFKRGALADDAVTAYITEHTEPAYVDLTDADDPAAAEAARLLGIGPIPTLVLIDENREVARLEGGVGKSRLIAWLRDGVESMD